MASIAKNIASQHMKFSMVSTAGAADASATVTVWVTKDGGAQASGGGTVTNLGNGQYDYAPTQAETNATNVGFLFTATGDVPKDLSFYPDASTAAGYAGVDWASINAPTTTVGLTGTTISSSQTVASVSGAVGSVTGNIGGVSGVTFPATVASPTNITAGTITTVSGNVNGSVASVTGAVGSVTGSVGSVTSAVAITSNVKKNQALSGFTFLMTNSTTHAPQTGLTVTSTVSQNGGSFGSTTNSPVEIANGWYYINLSAADMNGNVISLRLTATAADDRDLVLVTQP